MGVDLDPGPLPHPFPQGQHHILRAHIVMVGEQQMWQFGLVGFRHRLSHRGLQPRHFAHSGKPWCIAAHLFACFL